MKLFTTFSALIGLALSALISPAMADAPRFAGRGWAEGVHSVAYTTNDGMNYITAAELASAGVDIYDQRAVFAHLNLVSQNFGGCGLVSKDPDGVGCFADDGVAGTVGPEVSRAEY